MDSKNPILQKILARLQDRNKQIETSKELSIFYSEINLKVIGDGK